MDAVSLDLDFLRRQTFGDEALAREVLTLFRAQVERVLPTLARTDRDEQTAAAHLLKGSCQGIGALAAADLLERFGTADPAGRHALAASLAETFAALDHVVALRLSAA